jgi:nicotinamide-nucleotide amidase
MPAMRARILAIGDELLLGRTVDTNSSAMARWLTDRGFHLDRTTVVGDAQRHIEEALIAASAGVEFVLVCGGLGPTDDDRTRYAVAVVTGQPLRENAEAWAQINAWYQANRPTKPLPEINRRQALFPRRAQVLSNERGTAPGIIIKRGRCRIVCMPGVPHELFGMLAQLDAYLPQWFPQLRPPTISEIYFAGIGESAAQERLGNLLTEHNPQVGITVSEKGHITLRVVGEKKVVAARARQLRQAMKPWLIPAPGPAPSIVQELTKIKKTIAAAESCTCGHMVAQLGAVAGASAILRESLVAYHEQVKVKKLGVAQQIITTHGIVSEAVASAMALGMRRYAQSDYAIATTGIAGPTGGSDAVPVGTVCVAIADKNGVIARTIRVRGERERVQARAAAHALVFAYEVIIGRVKTSPMKPAQK